MSVVVPGINPELFNVYDFMCIRKVGTFRKGGVLPVNDCSYILKINSNKIMHAEMSFQCAPEKPFEVNKKNWLIL
jgi:hypothetical protein